MSQKIPPDTIAVMYRPILIRAAIAALFGLATIIIQEPNDAVVNYGSAIFLVLSGSSMWEYLRRDPVPEAMRSPLSLIAAVWMLAALTLIGVQLGALTLSAVPVGALSVTVPWITVSAGLGIAWIAELSAFSWRKAFAPARDHLIAGIVGIVTAGLYIFIQVLDYHRIFGIAGTYA